MPMEKPPVFITKLLARAKTPSSETKLSLEDGQLYENSRASMR